MQSTTDCEKVLMAGGHQLRVSTHSLGGESLSTVNRLLTLYPYGCKQAWPWGHREAWRDNSACVQPRSAATGVAIPHLRAGWSLAPSCRCATAASGGRSDVFRDACRSMRGMPHDTDAQGRELTVRTGKRDGMVGVVFGNEGPGMPPGAIKKIFEPLFRTIALRGRPRPAGRRADREATQRRRVS